MRITLLSEKMSTQLAWWNLTDAILFHSRKLHFKIIYAMWFTFLQCFKLCLAFIKPSLEPELLESVYPAGSTVVFLFFCAHASAYYGKDVWEVKFLRRYLLQDFDPVEYVLEHAPAEENELAHFEEQVEFLFFFLVFCSVILWNMKK